MRTVKSRVLVMGVIMWGGLFLNCSDAFCYLTVLDNDISERISEFKRYSFATKSTVGQPDSDPLTAKDGGAKAPLWKHDDYADLVAGEKQQLDASMATVTYTLDGRTSTTEELFHTFRIPRNHKWLIDPAKVKDNTQNPWELRYTNVMPVPGSTKEVISYKYYVKYGLQNVVYQKVLLEVVPNDPKHGSCLIRTEPGAPDGSVFAYNGSTNQVTASIGVGAPITYSVTDGNRTGLFGSERFNSWKSEGELVFNYILVDGVNVIDSLDEASWLKYYLDIDGDGIDEEYLATFRSFTVGEGVSALGGSMSTDIDAFTGASLSIGFDDPALINEIWAQDAVFDLMTGAPIDFTQVPSVSTDAYLCYSGSQVPEIPIAVFPVLIAAGAGFFIWKKRHAKK